MASTAIDAPHSGNVETRRRILSEACRLISEHGHEALQISQLAEASCVSRITIYRYFSTREYIISEATLEWAMNWVRHLPAPERLGTTIGERVTNVIHRILKYASKNPQMIRAIISMLVSKDSSVQSFQTNLRTMMPTLMEYGIGKPMAKNKKVGSATRILGHLIFGNLILLCAETTTISSSVDEISQTMKSLIGKQWDKRL